MPNSRPVAAEPGRTNRRRRARHPGTFVARRQADYVRQRRLRYGRERLGARLYAPACRLPAGARDFALARTRQSSLRIANDVGIEVIFLRQMIAQARPEDVAIGISTSGGSKNIVMALEEARKRNC